MTRICRFNAGRLGLLDGDSIVDVTAALSALSAVRWPFPLGDLLISNLSSIVAASTTLLDRGPRLPVDRVCFLSPVANPSKIIAAPVNYLRHQAEANADGGKNFASDVKTINEYGVFLKANSSVVGFGEGIEIAYPSRRTDHELELVAIVGTGGRNISEERALQHVAGYCIGLDMTIRGTEDRSLRKSLDSFSVIGPWLVTSDEIANPNALALSLDVNGVEKQRANTADLIYSIERLIHYASRFYTLYPGDIIFTGTPEGVGPVIVGDIVRCTIDGVGTARTTVRRAQLQH